VTTVTYDLVVIILTSIPVSGVSIMDRPSLAASVCKLAMAGEQAGFTVEQMIRLLRAGMTVETLLDVIERRLSEAIPEPLSSRWIM
jgi:hypothetical protein